MQRLAGRVLCLSAWVSVLSAVCGCGEIEPERPKPPFRSAQITLYPHTGKARPVTVVIGDAAKLRQLESFFPELGTGKQGVLSGGWEACGEINFRSANGATTTVLFEGRWLEMGGEWEWHLRPGFWEFLRDLLKAEGVPNNDLLKLFPTPKDAASTQAQGTGEGG